MPRVVRTSNQCFERRPPLVPATHQVRRCRPPLGGLAQMSACTRANLFATLTPKRSVIFHFSVLNSCRAATAWLPPRPRRLSRSSPACDEKQFCWIGDGPTSSKCDLTLMTSVLPLRPSTNRKKVSPQVPMWPVFQLAPLCDTFRYVFRVDRETDVALFFNATECLNGSPKLCPRNSLSAWHKTSQRTGKMSH